MVFLYPTCSADKLSVCLGSAMPESTPALWRAPAGIVVASIRRTAVLLQQTIYAKQEVGEECESLQANAIAECHKRRGRLIAPHPQGPGGDADAAARAAAVHAAP